MQKSRLTEERIIGFLKQHEAGDENYGPVSGTWSQPGHFEGVSALFCVEKLRSVAHQDHIVAQQWRLRTDLHSTIREKLSGAMFCMKRHTVQNVFLRSNFQLCKYIQHDDNSGNYCFG